VVVILEPMQLQRGGGVGGGALRGEDWGVMRGEQWGDGDGGMQVHYCDAALSEVPCLRHLVSAT
jgi:hypothetical protein